MDIIKETGNRQETGDRRQDTGEETGDRILERRQKAGGRRKCRLLKN